MTVRKTGLLIDGPGLLEIALGVNLVMDSVLFIVEWLVIMEMVILVAELRVSLVTDVVVDIVLFLL